MCFAVVKEDLMFFAGSKSSLVHTIHDLRELAALLSNSEGLQSVLNSVIILSCSNLREAVFKRDALNWKEIRRID